MGYHHVKHYSKLSNLVAVSDIDLTKVKKLQKNMVLIL